MKSVQPLAVSFQPSPAEAERTSTFQLDGHRPPLSLEPEGWLVAFVPVSGAPADLLCRQAAICGPAKVTAGRRSPRRTSQTHTATAPHRAVNFVRKAPSSATAQHPSTSGDRARAYRNPK